MLSTLFFVAIGLGQQTFATMPMDSTSGFSYAAAERAYATASVPPKEAFAKEWIAIGAVYGSSSEHSKDYYTPDGKFQMDGYPGYFQYIHTYTQSKDAFGNEIYSRTSQIVGFETGKVYERYGPDAGMLTPFAYVFDTPERDSACAQHWECRLVEVTPGPMILCAGFITDKRKSCAGYIPADPKKAATYAGHFPRSVPAPNPPSPHP